MFLPTRIEHPYERTPYVTNTLLGVNIVAFLLTFRDIEHGLDHLMFNTLDFQIWQPITSMFLHGSFWHLLGNMLFLAVYGKYVEERLGSWRYLGAYLLFGLIAGGLWGALNDGRALGASGAIAGLMGFVLVGAPFAKVRVIFVLWVYVYVVFKRFQLAALWLVGMWIFWQILYAWMASPWDNVGYAAHFGGFGAGCALAVFLKSERCKGTDWWLDDALPGGGPAATKRLDKARATWRPAAAEAPDPEHLVALQTLGADTSPVAVIKLLMKRLGLAPERAKEHVDAIRNGDPQQFGFDDVDAAELFLDEAEELGVGAAALEPSAAP